MLTPGLRAKSMGILKDPAQQRNKRMRRSRLQDELQKKQPFEVLEQEALLNILRVNDLFMNRFGRLFREHGLTNSQYNVLRILRGEARPMRCLEIADRLIQVVPAITGLIDRLVTAGLVTRTRDTNDGRVYNIEITEKAQQTLIALDKPVVDLHVSLIGHLTPDELQQLIALLEKARAPLA